MPPQDALGALKSASDDRDETADHNPGDGCDARMLQKVGWIEKALPGLQHFLEILSHFLHTSKLPDQCYVSITRHDLKNTSPVVTNVA
jgi:hypothetical protein